MRKRWKKSIIEAHREMSVPKQGADKWIDPENSKVVRVKPVRFTGEVSLEIHEALNAKERMEHLRLNCNRGETGSRIVTKYNSKHTASKPNPKPSKGWL